MGGMYGPYLGYGWLFSLVYIALASFVFGIMFWWTYHIMNGKKRR